MIAPQGRAARPIAEKHVEPSWAVTCDDCGVGLGAYPTEERAAEVEAEHVPNCPKAS